MCELCGADECRYLETIVDIESESASVNLTLARRESRLTLTLKVTHSRRKLQVGAALVHLFRVDLDKCNSHEHQRKLC